MQARSQKRTVLVITHRPSLAGKCDRILMLRNGQVEIFGFSKEVLDELAQRQSPVQPPEASQTLPPRPLHVDEDRRQ